MKSYCEKEKKEYLLREWNIEKNGSLTPDTVTHSSQIPVWWRCENGHSWRTQVRSRATTLSSCPRCLEERLEEKRTLQMSTLKKSIKTAGGTL